MLCSFFQIDANNYKCSDCGLTMYSADGSPPVFVCNNKLPRNENNIPSFIEKMKNFARASVDHVKSGAKLASDSTIQNRYNECLRCEFFIKESCSKCGCPIFAHKKYISKLSWAEQSCPVGKWGREIT